MSQSADIFSFSVVRLELATNGETISTATGFFYKFNSEYYLVSNWHVFSGRHCENGQPLHSGMGIPDSISFSSLLSADGKYVTRMARFDLSNKNGDPRWIQHPDGQKADIAALRIDLPSSTESLVAINEAKITPDMNIGVGDDVFVLGFPLGLALQETLPIWKRASIASEPRVSLRGTKGFLIDAVTNKGMSGAPVVAMSRATYLSQDGSILPGPGRKFLGVYSGRHMADGELGAQIGRVWSTKVLLEVFAKPTIPTYNLKSS